MLCMYTVVTQSDRELVFIEDRYRFIDGFLLLDVEQLVVESGVWGEIAGMDNTFDTFRPQGKVANLMGGALPGRVS